MIARLRGEHQDYRGRWRPSAVRIPDQSEQLVDVYDGIPIADDLAAPAPATGQPLWTRTARALTRWAIWLVLVSVAYVAISWGVHQITPQPAAVPLPVTPRAWLDQYEASALDNPGRVCSELFAPQLARAYAGAAHGSCRGYFARVSGTSVTVRRILVLGATAVLELRQTLERREWAVVLAHQNGGWRAVDLLGLAH